MQVQDRTLPPRSPPRHPPPSDDEEDGRFVPNGHLRRQRFSKARSLDFSTWVCDNLAKVAFFVLLFTTLVAVVFLRRLGGGAASLLCFESRVAAARPGAARIPYPRVAWTRIPPLPPLPGPTASFKSDRWIVVSAPKSPPSDPLRRLARLRGWQLLVVGDSSTPPDWSLRGALFLSLEDQSKLGFRVVDLLPYRSFLRKPAGYLFAIQHGARQIFDADDRAAVLADDLARRFDLDLLAGPSSLLQYTHRDPNRTVVNPYVHFGQRSVWPRGLPLEKVGAVNGEDFYTEVASGGQYIQQGLSDGLPDVDAVFYFTRKSTTATFDIRFDGDAPKVALPQGIMAPVNSFNTLFHYQAFWGLMLPADVSTMAGDVIRGYWAQRLLWEIGGYVAFYPPTVHRVDTSGGYPFAEEKDLHVNVGRLIEFLLMWRSKKLTFFERALELSYRMAEEGFWTEKEVRMTSAWLQDLAAVGYQEPRLMSLELDRMRATIGHGDRKEYVAKQMPSVHLDVEETGTVGFEIGNLIRWRGKFGNVVLVVFCTALPERAALEWRLLYGRIFKTVIVLAEETSPELGVGRAQLAYAYRYLPKIFQQYTSTEGFLFLQDDMILNYWNLLDADTTKLWITNKVPSSWFSVSDASGNSSEWAAAQAKLVKQAVNTLPVHFSVNYKEAVGEGEDGDVVLCGSEIFYVPSRLAGDFVDLVDLVKDVDLHQMAAVPMFFMAMDKIADFDSGVLSGVVYDKGLRSNSTCADLYSAKVPGVYPCHIGGEVDFVRLIRLMANGDPLLMELV
ncbi:putative glycosyltransferase STELLO1 [Wolffia australiana]